MFGAGLPRRLYPLSEMPSYDMCFSDAEVGIMSYRYSGCRLRLSGSSRRMSPTSQAKRKVMGSVSEKALEFQFIFVSVRISERSWRLGVSPRGPRSLVGPHLGRVPGRVAGGSRLAAHSYQRPPTTPGR